MSFWANLVGYQCVWFAAVIGAGRGLWWPAVAAAALFALLHLALHPQTTAQRAVDFRLMAVAIGCGLLLDGGLVSNGLADYAAGDVAVPGIGAPLWILSLWAAFSLTLRHSMTFLLHRPLLAAAFGALGGPLAYLGAARGWQAIAFAEPRWMALTALSIGWCVAIALLTTLAVRWSPRTRVTAAVPAGSAS